MKIAAISDLHGHLPVIPKSNRPCGSRSLLAAIDRVNPRLCVFDHIHEGRGQWERNGTILANVAHVDRAYRAVHEAMVFDL